MLKLLDAKFRRIPGHYVVQCLLAAAAMMVVLALSGAGIAAQEGGMSAKAREILSLIHI